MGYDRTTDDAEAPTPQAQQALPLLWLIVVNPPCQENEQFVNE